MKKKTLFKSLYPLILALWILFIFSNSLRPGEASNVQSEQVTNVLNDLLSLFNGSLSSSLVRMLAHVGEFFVLGALLYPSIPLYGKNSPFELGCLFGSGICIAVLDETIQSFVPGRSMSILDMLLDAFGVTIGFWGLFLFIRFWIRKTNKNGGV